MKQFLLMTTYIVMCSLGYSQTEPCWTDVLHQNYLQQHPEAAIKFHKIEEQAQNAQWITKSATKIIPVVFHIVHEGGSENISQAQILNALQILNQDFRNLNPRRGNRPTVFDSVAGDMGIEFRLAKKDPQGNCTDGIIRTYKPDATTVSFDSINQTEINLKSDAWDNSKYLNIWVVKDILIENGTPGVIGFARYPYYAGPGNPIDGVVIRHDYVGSSGTAVAPQGLGATFSHEVGHWLGLMHTWGGAAFLSCGDDFVDDTPLQYQQNWGCPSYPHLSNCNGTTNAPHGDQFMNFMDYVDGACMNLFTEGQKLRATGFLNTIRHEIWSPNNLIETGVSDSSTINLTCKPIASFYSSTTQACVGASVQFFNDSYNGSYDQLKWTFQGANLTTSTQANPTVTYANSGVYDVKLVLYKGIDSSVITKTAFIRILPNTGMVNQAPYQEPFEDFAQWTIYNQDAFSPTWKQVVINGNSSMMIKNFEDTLEQHIDEFVSPTYDLTQITNPKIYFKVAHALKGTSLIDRLSLMVSRDCGATWTNRYNKAGNALKTAETQATYFVPNATQWRQEVVTLNSSFITNNVRFKFVFRSGKGNNIYIDDFNILDPSTVSVTELSTPKVVLIPNPSSGSVQLKQLLPQHEVVVKNLLGQTLIHLTASEGEPVIDVSAYGAGFYFVEIKGSLQQSTQILVVQ